MEMLISTILSDLTSRSISFLIDKCSRPAAAATAKEALNSLQRLLLRVHVIVEEAEQRHITDQTMLQQLSQIRKEMYRGYYTLDVFRCRDHKGQAAVTVSPSSTPSRINLNPAKRLCFRSGSISSSEHERLHEVLGRLEATIRDASELIVLLIGCPRRCRQPYSMYLFLDNCMLGRQMEMEQVIEFLLQDEVPFDGIGSNPGVLPIVGGGRVGKSTLIEHACMDERVRDKFSKIMHFSQNSIRDERMVATLSDCDVVKHCRGGATAKGKILLIIEVTGDIDEDVWRKLYSDCKHHTASGSKIIVASRSDKIARFGTTQALKVECFTPEMYWYFFKVRTFGSTDTEEHPKVVSIAMELAREMNGGFFGAGVFSGLLKGNFDAHTWGMALAAVREFKRMNLMLLGSDFTSQWQVPEPVFVRRANSASSEYFVSLDDYQTSSVEDSAQIEGPQMSIRDLVFGDNVTPRGRFRVLAWRSHIPPHYSYMMSGEVRRPQRMFSRKKRISRLPADNKCI